MPVAPAVHLSGPKHSPIAFKLVLGFGLLIAILAVSGVVSYRYIEQINGQLHKVVAVKMPLETAALELEINANETVRALLRYVRSLEPERLEKITESEADFHRFATQFHWLAETDDERRLSQEVAGLYIEFKALGDQVVALADERGNLLQTFTTNVKAIKDLVDNALVNFTNPVDSDGTRKLQTAFNLRILINETLPLVTHYVMDPDITEKTAFNNAGLEFKRLIAIYRENNLSADEKDSLDQFSGKFFETMEVGRRTITVVENMNVHLNEIYKIIVMLDDLLDDSLQPLISAETARAAQEARASTDAALVLIFALAGIAFTVGGASAWAIIHHDITQSKQVERVLARHVEDLARSNAELEQFAFVASHDLQEPLRKVQAFSDRLKSRYAEVIDEQGQDYSDRMQNATRRMQSLIESLLTFSRVSSGAQPFAPVDLNDVARAVVSDMELRIQETGATVDIANLPTIDADALQMRQLFQNLFSNALKYRRADTNPVVKVAAQIVGNGLPAVNGTPARTCQITVADNGIGFDEKYAERIFGLFQRLHGRDKFEGTGVGLAICRKIATRHGGSITANSRAGHGASFVVTFPMNGSRKERA